MKLALRFTLAGGFVLLALAGCGRGVFQMGERAPWRHDAEVACLKSGAVKMGAGVVRMEPIEGPGMCGADFPLKVSALGEGGALGYSDEPMPPGSIPNAQMPNWPPRQLPSQPRYAPPQPVQTEPLNVAPAQSYPQQGYSQPAYPQQGGQMHWVTGPPGIDRPQTSAPAGEPMPIDPPGGARADDIPPDAILPSGRERAAPTYPPRQSYNQPAYQPPPQQRALPPLGPMRGPSATTAMMPATLTPAATLACPIVSALDRWVSEGVQPAALHWFRSPVVTIKQISAYSCREMVGAAGSHMSEHAYGNALDIAAFVLADGRTITVKDGWHGAPEEQGFLHDVQLYACETFVTVLAPGYNIYHYNHIHVDLMKRASGRRPCRPNAISGEVAAAKARAIYAARHHGPSYTGSVPEPKRPDAVPGGDGYVADEDGDAVTGSISRSPAHRTQAIAGADGETDDSHSISRLNVLRQDTSSSK
jgi:hypothetical protein